VPDTPLYLRVSHDRRRIFIVSQESIMVVDANTYTPITTVSVQNHERGRPVARLSPTPHGKRGVAFLPDSSDLTVLDFDAGKVVASITTGRTKPMSDRVGTLFKDFGLSVLAGMLSGGYYVYQTETKPVGNEIVAMHPDAKTAYVVNSKSNDLTIIDVQSASVVEIIGVFGIPVVISPNLLAILLQDRFDIIDTHMYHKIFEYDILELQNLIMTPDWKYAVLLLRESLLFIDARSGNTVNTFDILEAALDMVIMQSPSNN
jgi:YVTN family beta-propeller protein